jgi:hypothetical protein
MNRDYFQNSHKPRSLNAHIRDVERQLVQDQHKVRIRRTNVVNAIKRQITAPSSLLLCAGIGFIIGEMTWKPKKSKRIGTIETSNHSDENTPLMTTLKVLVSIHTLYKTLPMHWLKKTFKLGGVSKSSHKPPSSHRPEPSRL